MAFEIIEKDRLIYFKSSAYITRESSDEIENTIIESINDKEETEIHVFDLSDLEYFDLRCLRPFILAQQKARTKKEDCHVVIIPPRNSMKKFLLDQAAIRSEEVCSSVANIQSHLKYKNQKMGKSRE